MFQDGNGNALTNYVFVVQYDYDLNEQSVTIPSGCTLKFEGGSIKNGTLVGDFKIDADDVKIFDEIEFSGAIVNSEIKVAWFVSEYPASDSVYTIDNTAEIQQALDCGGKYIVFPSNRYLCITDTLEVNNPLDILVDKKINDILDGNRGATSVPCIFTKDVVTMLEYNAMKGNIVIGAINLVCHKDFSDTSEKDTPILNIINTGYQVWGLDIYANIKATDRLVTFTGTNKYYLFNFTGIKITADTQFIAIVNIYGYIRGVYTGIVTERINGSWFNDVTIHGFTWCVRGGVFGNGGITKVFNNHQVRAYYTSSDYSSKAYFEGHNILIYGMIWDLGLDASTYHSDNTVDNSVKAYAARIAIKYDTFDIQGVDVSDVVSTSVSKAIEVSTVKNSRLFEFPNYLSGCKNLLNILLQGDNATRSTIFGTSSYTVKATVSGSEVTVNLLNNPTNDNGLSLYNFDNLFNSEYPALSYNNTLSYMRNAFLRSANISDISKYEVDFSVIVKVPIKFPDMCLVYKSMIAANTELTIERLDSSNNVLETIYDDSIGSLSYFDSVATVSPVLSASNRYRIQISFTYTQGVNNRTPLFLPSIILATPVSMNYEMFNDASHRPNILSNYNTGFTGLKWFDTSLKRPIVWDGERWVDGIGCAAFANKGTTANRPTNNLHINDEGFEYFDTSLMKPIYFNMYRTLATSTNVTKATVYIENPCSTGANYLYLINDYVGESLAFSTTNDGEGTDLAINTVIYNGNKMYAEFTAPDSTQYPYIKLVSSTRNYAVTFALYKCQKRWIETDGVVAGTGRGGNFSDVQIAPDTPIGFKYFWTDINAEAIWNGSFLGLDHLYQYSKTVTLDSHKSAGTTYAASVGSSISINKLSTNTYKYADCQVLDIRGGDVVVVMGNPPKFEHCVILVKTEADANNRHEVIAIKGANPTGGSVVTDMTLINAIKASEDCILVVNCANELNSPLYLNRATTPYMVKVYSNTPFE